MRTPVLDCFNFFVLCGIVVEGKSTSGHIVTRNYVSVKWISDFLLELSSTKCHNYSVAFLERTQMIEQLPWNESTVMDGNFVNLTFSQCNDTESPPVHINFHYPELVKNVSCYRVSNQNAVCSWTPNTHVQELKFFYVFIKEHEIRQESEIPQLISQVKECPSYNENEGKRTRCNLQFSGTPHHPAPTIFISFRDGEDKNTFRIPLTKVKPPTLNWNVSKMEDKFHIQWNIYPELSADWKITIKYRGCDKETTEDIDGTTSSIYLSRVSYCPYWLTIKATSSKGETQWTEFKYFGAESPFIYTYAAIFFPVMFASLAAVVFFCFMRNRDRLFPKIPQPRDLLSGISDSHFKSTPDNFYPNSREELCKISFVSELQCGNMKPLKHPLL